MSYARSPFVRPPSNVEPPEVRLADPGALTGIREADVPAGGGRGAVDDPLADFLARLHFPNWRAAVLELDGPDLLSVDGAAAWFYVAVDGECSIDVEGSRAPTRLERGAAAIVAAGTRHELRVGSDASEGPPAPALILAGSYAAGAMGAHPLDSLLSPLTVVSRQQSSRLPCPPLVDWLAAEATSPSPGSAAVVSRLLQALLVDVLRVALSAETHDAPSALKDVGPLQAAFDPCLGAVLRLVHAQPERDWTVHSMARESGLSRSAFADRFRTVVGQPPLQYVTEIRMQKASELLESTDVPVKRIASLVGYESVSAFSSAFKRRFGWPPISMRAAKAIE